QGSRRESREGVPRSWGLNRNQLLGKICTARGVIITLRAMSKVWCGFLALVFTVSLAAAQVQLGNEIIATNGFKELRGKRIGLITNPSGVNSRLQSTIDVLRRAPGVKLVALFAPEHGLTADVPAGTEFPDATDA